MRSFGAVKQRPRVARFFFWGFYAAGPAAEHAAFASAWKNPCGIRVSVEDAIELPLRLFALELIAPILRFLLGALQDRAKMIAALGDVPVCRARRPRGSGATSA
jgi:hypothetical protein